MGISFRPLRAEEIDVRISTISQKGCSLLLFKDARCDMNILDETVGAENWQRNHELINGNLFCNVGIRVDRGDGQSEWVWKQDVGVESYTEKEKGQASDAFKRACFCWGLGRELYTAPFIWVDKSKVNLKQKEGSNKLTTYDNFAVKDIEYKDGKITKLVIVNKSRRGEVAYTLGKYDEDEEDDAANEIISAKDVEYLKAMMKRKGVEGSKYGGKLLSELTAAEYANAIKQLGNMQDVA